MIFILLSFQDTYKNMKLGLYLLRIDKVLDGLRANSSNDKGSKLIAMKFAIKLNIVT